MPNVTNPQDLNRYSYVLNSPLRYRDPTGHWYCTGDGCEDYVQWILDTMGEIGPISQELVAQFLKYDQDKLNGNFHFQFDVEMSGMTQGGASAESICFKFGTNTMPKEEAISAFAHEMRHVLDGIKTSIQDETRAYQTQFRVAEEYVAWAGLDETQRHVYLRDTQNSWLYPGGYGNGQAGDFMALNPDSRRDLEVARAMIVSWVPEAGYGDKVTYPTFPRSWVEWQFILIPRAIGDFFRSLFQ